MFGKYLILNIKFCTLISNFSFDCKSVLIHINQYAMARIMTIDLANNVKYSTQRTNSGSIIKLLIVCDPSKNLLSSRTCGFWHINVIVFSLCHTMVRKESLQL